MAAAAPLELLTPFRAILSRVEEPTRAWTAEDVDRWLEHLTALAARPPTDLVAGQTEADVVGAIRILLRVLGDALEGFIRSAVRAAAPDRLAHFDALVVQLKAWIREADGALAQRLQLLSDSDAIMDEHDDVYRALAR